jgi:hypothetical protein
MAAFMFGVEMSAVSVLVIHIQILFQHVIGDCKPLLPVGIVERKTCKVACLVTSSIQIFSLKKLRGF